MYFCLNESVPTIQKVKCHTCPRSSNRAGCLARHNDPSTTKTNKGFLIEVCKPMRSQKERLSLMQDIFLLSPRCRSGPFLFGSFILHPPLSTLSSCHLSSLHPSIPPYTSYPHLIKGTRKTRNTAIHKETTQCCAQHQGRFEQRDLHSLACWSSCCSGQSSTAHPAPATHPSTGKHNLWDLMHQDYRQPACFPFNLFSVANQIFWSSNSIRTTLALASPW